MQNIGQNWILIIAGIAILAFFILRRGRGHGGFGGHGHGSGGAFDPDAVGSHGGHGHHRHGGGDHEQRDASRGPGNALDAAIDPVTGTAIPTAGAVTSIYAGKAYYFASKENRDRFEAAPQDFAAKPQGVAASEPGTADRPRRKGRGC